MSLHFLNFTQGLQILSSDGEHNHDILIDIENLVERSTINIDGKTTNISDDLQHLIVSWIHEKKLKQLEYLESGQLDPEFRKKYWTLK